LREPGGADLYPALEIQWKRGHDPQLEVRRCRTARDPRRPAGESGAGGVSDSELVEKVSLASFNTAQLHYLLQCHGLTPARRIAATPVAESAARACEMLPEPFWGSSTMYLSGVLLLLPLALALRWCGIRPGGPARFLGTRGAKLKREEDGADATVEVPMDAI